MSGRVHAFALSSPKIRMKSSVLRSDPFFFFSFGAMTSCFVDSLDDGVGCSFNLQVCDGSVM